MKPCKEAVDAIKKILEMPQENPKEGITHLADDFEEIWEDMINGRDFDTKLHILLDGLSDEALSDICAVMLAGRGDFSTYAGARKKEYGFTKDETILYITGKTLRLKRYLGNGMKTFAA